jgi:hypothetical protein
MTGELMIGVEDLRKSGVCSDAAKWFESNGMSWREFVLHGIAASRIEATGNAIALRVVAEARARAGVKNGAV